MWLVLSVSLHVGDSDEDPPTRVNLRSGEGRQFSQGTYPGEIRMTRRPVTCPLNERAEKAKGRSELLDCLKSSEQKAKVMGDWILATTWNTSFGELSKRVQQLAKVNDVAATDRQHAVHLQDVLSLSWTVANVSQHYVGRYLMEVQAASDGSYQQVLIDIGNAAESLKIEEYQNIRDNCADRGCDECCRAREWELQAESEQERERPVPCISTQVTVKLLSGKYNNMTPTFFRQCKKFSQAVPVESPLTFFPEPVSDLRLLAADLPRRLESTKQCSSLATGCHPVFKVDGPVLDSIHYTDGDGGYLCCDNVPGLVEHLQKAGAADLIVEGMIPFREANHDAIELGHKYELDDESGVSCWEFGYMALVQARKNVAVCTEALVVPLTKDRRQGRLMVEIFTRGEADRREEMDICLIKAGLSFPIDGAPEHCKQALLQAKQAMEGVWKCGDLADHPDLRPWVLKRKLVNPDRDMDTKRNADGSVELKVLNVSTRLNESHVMVAKSTIEGADRGLFLRPRCRMYTIPPKKAICSYQLVPDEEEDTSVTSDYLLDLQKGGRTFLYQAPTYNGQNVGRFINQGGLREGLAKMCYRSDRTKGCVSFCPRDVEEVFRQHCNVQYTVRRREAVVVSTKEIQVHPGHPIELFSNYGLSYWVKFALRHWEDIGLDHFMVKSVLWCLLSQGSVWSDSDKRKFSDPQLLQGIPDEVKRRFQQMTWRDE